MLSKEKITEPNSLEVHLCQALDKCNREQMSDEDAKIMLKLLLIPDKDFGSNPELNNAAEYQVLKKRIEHCLTAKFDSRSIYFILLVGSSIGSRIMYLYYTQYLAKKKGIQDITFDIFCRDLYPYGFINDEDLRTIWYKCKVNNGNVECNLIDFSSAALSIQF